MNVGFISLGCSKNLVDTENTIGIFKKNNLNVVSDAKKADIIVINTCGFIESAKQEAINTILEMAEYKKNGKCKYLIVMGCLVQRYKEDLQKAMPEVNLFLSIDEYDDIWNKIERIIVQNCHEGVEGRNRIKGTYLSPKGTTCEKDVSPLFYSGCFDRVITTGSNMAYLKIAEGCSNNCTYCAIPYIRGPYISRPIEEVLEEAKSLAKSGIRELVVIAQDTTKYGMDLYGESKLAYLLKELCKIDELIWIRFLYTYPESVTDELISVVRDNDKICRYFDIPLQHISDAILKRMNRKTNRESIENLIEKIRKEIPNVVLRTSLIVGFPGETEEDFNELYDFVKKVKIDKIRSVQVLERRWDSSRKIKKPDTSFYKGKKVQGYYGIATTNIKGKVREVYW